MTSPADTTDDDSGIDLIEPPTVGGTGTKCLDNTAGDSAESVECLLFTVWRLDHISQSPSSPA